MAEIKVDRIPKYFQKEKLGMILENICKTNDIVLFGFFGSYVRNEQTKKSDLDIAIEFSPKSHKTLLDLIRIENKLSKLFKCKVDLGIYSAINPHILNQVDKEIQIIYEKR